MIRNTPSTSRYTITNYHNHPYHPNHWYHHDHDYPYCDISQSHVCSVKAAPLHRKFTHWPDFFHCHWQSWFVGSWTRSKEEPDWLTSKMPSPHQSSSVPSEAYKLCWWWACMHDDDDDDRYVPWSDHQVDVLFYSSKGCNTSRTTGKQLKQQWYHTASWWLKLEQSTTSVLFSLCPTW